MKTKIKVHDGIVGAIMLATILLGVYVNPVWFWVPGVVSGLLVVSAFTGFCPVYFVLDKVMPADAASSHATKTHDVAHVG